MDVYTSTSLFFIECRQQSRHPYILLLFAEPYVSEIQFGCTVTDTIEVETHISTSTQTSACIGYFFFCSIDVEFHFDPIVRCVEFVSVFLTSYNIIVESQLEVFGTFVFNNQFIISRQRKIINPICRQYHKTKKAAYNIRSPRFSGHRSHSLP